MKLYIENCHHECAINDDELKFLNFVYAHGKLQEKADFDLLNERKKDKFDKRKNYNGLECVAVLPTGEEIEALLFYWNATKVYIRKHRWPNEYTYRQVFVTHKGLLVAKDDEAAVKYATKCFKERRKDL